MEQTNWNISNFRLTSLCFFFFLTALVSVSAHSKNNETTLVTISNVGDGSRILYRHADDESEDADDDSEKDDLVDVLNNGDVFSTLAAALEVANLVEDFECEGNSKDCKDYTVFAPNNAAFEDNTIASTITKYIENESYRVHLRALLLYHITKKTYTYSRIDTRMKKGKDYLKTLYKIETVSIDIGNNNLFVNDAKVLEEDTFAKNGVIHDIDRVLLPSFVRNSILTTLETDSDDNMFTKLLARIDLVDLDEFLGDNSNMLTFFAPTDEAFDKIATLLFTDDQLRDVIRYHIITDAIENSNDLSTGSIGTEQGENINIDIDGLDSIKINDRATILQSDMLAANGVIHVIDEVLIPPSIFEDVFPTIGDIVRVNGGVLNTLEVALETANLLVLFDKKKEGPYTVFAPTNAAFLDKFDGDTSSIPFLDPDILGDQLRYHVLNGRFSIDDLSNSFVESLLGTGLISIDVDAGNVTINGNAHVVTANIEASNGIVHIIDGFLEPNTVLDVATEEGYTRFSEAIGLTNLAEQLNEEGPFTVFVPTNHAMKELGDLSDYSASELEDILKYHIVDAYVTRSNLEVFNDGEIPTLQGDEIIVYHDVEFCAIQNAPPMEETMGLWSTVLGPLAGLASSEYVTLDASYDFPELLFEDCYSLIGLENTATVNMVDISASNGVIHVIDSVLLPR